MNYELFNEPEMEINAIGHKFVSKHLENTLLSLFTSFFYLQASIEKHKTMYLTGNKVRFCNFLRVFKIYARKF